MFCRNILRYRQLPSKVLGFKFYGMNHSDHYYHVCQRNLDKECTPPTGRLDNVQNENNYLHKYLANNKLYVNSIAFLDYLNAKDENCVDLRQIFSETYADKSSYTILCYLKKVLKTCSGDPSIIKNSKVTELCETMCQKMPELSDEHLWNLMKVLTLWPNCAEDQRFFNLCKTVDESALERCRNWGYDRNLLTIDHFFRLKTLRYSEFAVTSLKRLLRNPGKLSPQQVVHAMFLVNTMRRWIKSVEMIDIETVLMSYIYDLSAEEVGILALAFFKTRTRVQNVNLVEMMYHKLENRVDDINDYSLASYLKLFRFCAYQSLENCVVRLSEKLINRVDNVPIACCTHIALLGTGHWLFLPKLLQKVGERFYKDIQSARLKDLERISFVLQFFNFIPEQCEDINQKITESLFTREEEIHRYPKVFFNLIHYLSLGGYYNYELVNKALSNSFLKHALDDVNKFSIPQNLINLSVGIKLERPDYEGNHLRDDLIFEFCQFTRIIPPSDTRKLEAAWLHLHSIKNILDKIFGSSKFTHFVYTIPHAVRADIIFCLKDKQPVEIPKSMVEMNFLPVKSPPNLNGVWYAIVLLSKKNLMNPTKLPTGFALSQLKHRELLGYKNIQISEYEFEKADRYKYLKNLIKNITK